MESMNDMLIECVKALGGSKQVGPLLWPEKAPDAAQRLLLACLNDDRSERLSPDQVLLILRMARKAGFHAGMQFLCGELGYAEPQPVEPRDEMADLMRDFNAAVALQGQIAERMEKAAARVGLRAVT